MAIDVDELERRSGVGYLNLAHDSAGRWQVYDKPALRELTTAENEDLRRELLGLRTPYTGQVSYAPGGQFWVSRKRLRARPRAFYERLYAALTDASHPLLSRSSEASLYPGRTLHVFFAEVYWHYILGEPEAYRPPNATYAELPMLGSPPSAAAVAHLGLARGQVGSGSSSASWSSALRQKRSKWPCDRPQQWQRRCVR